MRVIVEIQTGIGGIITHVYEYSQEKMRELIENDFNWARNHNMLENEDEVQEILDESEIYSADIIMSDRGIHYEVCEVKQGGNMNNIYAEIKRIEICTMTMWIYKVNDYDSIYNKMMNITNGDHEISSDAASWCELATVGDTYEFCGGEIEIKEL